MYPFKNILFPTDFSPLSRGMLKYAAAFARRHEARLYICNVQEASVPPQALRLSERALSEHGYEWLIAIRRELEELAGHSLVAGLDVHVLLAEGNPADEIVRLVAEHNIDLVTMAATRRGAFGSAMMGSTTEAILERVTCPVLTARHPSKDFVYYRGSETTIALNRILFATDLSASDDPAKTLTAELARTHGSQTLLLHALGVFLGYVRAVSLTSTDEIEANIRRDASEKLAAIANEFTGIETTALLNEGRAYEEILSVAEARDMDLIVIGTGHRRTGNVLGRNAERVIRNAGCPVLVVPATE